MKNHEQTYADIYLHTDAVQDREPSSLLDILTATALGLILCALALAYFDILTY